MSIAASISLRSSIRRRKFRERTDRFVALRASLLGTAVVTQSLGNRRSPKRQEILRPQQRDMRRNVRR